MSSFKVTPSRSGVNHLYKKVDSQKSYISLKYCCLFFMLDLECRTGGVFLSVKMKSRILKFL